MRKPYFADIQALPLFRDMELASFERLMRGAYVQTFPPQIQLITEGDPADFLHVLVDGQVELFASWNGRETMMAAVRPISTFILAATVKDAPYLMSARTLEKSRIVLLPSQDVREVFNSDVAFAKAIVTELALRYRMMVKHAKDLKLRSSIERLANYLLRQQRTGGSSSFELELEKRRLASLLGMTPENLSRAIKALREHGVEVDQARVVITNLEDLEALAKPDPLIDDLIS